jgi:hypothetical protein
MTRLKAYYRDDTKRLIKFFVRRGAKILYVKRDLDIPSGKYDYIIVDELIGDILDVQQFFIKLKTACNQNTRILITYYNFLWRPILKFATLIGWRKETEEQNWLDNNDISNLMHLAGIDIITRRQRLLIPVRIPLISDFVNQWIAPLPLINSLCLKTWTLARIHQLGGEKHSVSIIIPSRNEEGNIDRVPKTIPKFGSRQEIIFVEGHSKDATWAKIQKLLKSKRKKNVSLKAFKQKGVGKADAVRLGFSKAKNDILMILDADLTVDPKDLVKFYEVLAKGEAEFANGSRLVYPLEKEAMNTLNILGNKIFSWLFTWILGQKFKDTLCGTKALFRKDYIKIEKGRKFFGDFDPFGDYDLIFGAIKQGLSIAEIPVRYKERVYGTTNIRRFTHGWLLLKMSIFAFKKFNTWKN